MKPVNVINAASLQVATHPVSILRLRGNFRGTTADRWLMLFDSISTPADGSTPLIPAIPLPQNSPFFASFEIGALEFALGCYVCVSTTQSTKTLSVDTMDFSAELSDPEFPTGTTLVGDLTSAVTGLQVWTEAAGSTARKVLTMLEVDGTNLTTATQYIQLFAKDSVSAGDVPIAGGVFPIAVGQVLTLANGLHFGNTGRRMWSIDSASPFTNRYGCTVKISSTPSTYTACTGTACIRAEYKNQS